MFWFGLSRMKVAASLKIILALRTGLAESVDMQFLKGIIKRREHEGTGS
jgi:hypothetical protein